MIIFGYKCDAADIYIPPYITVGGYKIECEGMTEQEYVEYTRWGDYCFFDGAFVIIGVELAEGVSEYDLHCAARDYEDKLASAVISLTGYDTDEENYKCYSYFKWER